MRYTCITAQTRIELEAAGKTTVRWQAGPRLRPLATLCIMDSSGTRLGNPANIIS